MDELTKEELLQKHKSGKRMMTLGIIFLSISLGLGTVLSILAEIATIVFGISFFSETWEYSIALLVVFILFSVLDTGFFAAGAPLLAVGIVKRVKSNKRLKKMKKAEAAMQANETIVAVSADTPEEPTIVAETTATATSEENL